MQAHHGLAHGLQARTFGRKGAVATAASRPSSLIDDVKLFALTFAGGFLFVSLYLA
jgi:hypothetical protein